MAGVNRVFLIGIVVRPPVLCDGGARLLVGVSEAEGQRLQYVDVTLHRGRSTVVDDVAIAQAVYVEGHLVRSPDGRPRVDALAFFLVGDAPSEPEHGEAARTTHASPRPHERSAHPRRIHLGTSRERVVWVRPCRVGRVGTTP